MPGFGFGGGTIDWKAFFTVQMCGGLFLLALGLFGCWLGFIILKQPARQWIPDGTRAETVFLEWQARKWYKKYSKRSIMFAAMAFGILVSGAAVVALAAR